AVVVERDRDGSVPLDDERRILEHFPRSLDEHREHETRALRQTPRGQPQQYVEGDAVDHVREGVPVGEMLRVLRAEDDSVPELDVAALADGYAPHGEFDNGGCRYQSACGRAVDPPGAVVHWLAGLYKPFGALRPQHPQHTNVDQRVQRHVAPLTSGLSAILQ